tara:strand:+ start:1450 stop:1806 length:357 start_codon:yes stop_codon:yes gene_type:complete
MKKFYEAALREVSVLRGQVKMERTGSKMIDKALNVEKTKSTRALKSLSEQELVSDQAKKATYYSGASTVAITMLYQAWDVVGFPGGRDWGIWWEHEAVYGAMVWGLTVAICWLYKQGK